MTDLTLTGADFATELAQLRAAGPAARVVLPGGVWAWAITDVALLKSLMTDPRISKDARRHWPEFDSEATRAWVMYPWVAVSSMLTAHGAEHWRLRTLVSAAFTRRRIEELRPRITAIVAELCDQLAAAPAGASVDLRAGFADEVPSRVICELLGVASERARRLCEHTAAILDTTLTPEQAAQNFASLYAVLAELLAHKRAHPGDDVATALIAARDAKGDGLSEQELGDTLLLLVTAGYETTAHLLDQAIVAVLADPQLRIDLFMGQHDWSEVIEETLRLNPPLIHMPFRFATTDIDLGEVTIARGEIVLASLAAVGRDPGVHIDADLFDPGRENKTHLAFGHGPHYCLGAPLARLEAEIALPALLARFPQMTCAVEPAALARRPSLIVNGHDAIPTRLTPHQASKAAR
ncbi:cytochrome P450 [Nocardia sp. NPDC050697]|uniref:cytochrome P450 family protein n=1 Tax=Nocardia sp. NPDC050697 TaxID=3155158 RepID=UPI0033E23C5B